MGATMKARIRIRQSKLKTLALKFEVGGIYLAPMDKDWFKRRQRMAGIIAQDIATAIGRDRSVVSRIYNGHQRMTVDQARQIAALLDAPLSEVMQRAGLVEASEAPGLSAGFSESEAAPFQRGDEPAHDADDTIAAALGRRPGVDVWTVRGASLQMSGFIPGDRILVDTHRAQAAKNGDCVVAQVYDWSIGSAKTVLRRYHQPVLVAHAPDANSWRPYVVDNDRVSVVGVVTASWRTQ